MTIRKEFKEFRGEVRDFRKKLKAAAVGGFTPEEKEMLKGELAQVVQEGAEVLGATAELALKIKEFLEKEL